jgi:hypothetical protein
MKQYGNMLFGLLFMVFMTGCKTDYSIIGTYSRNDNILVINDDSSFVLKMKSAGFGVNTCRGIITHQNLNLYELYCIDDLSPPALASNYMPQRDWQLEILTRNGISIDGMRMRKRSPN